MELREGSVESSEGWTENVEECHQIEGEECVDRGVCVSMNKRMRLGPVFSDNQECTIIEFVKAHPELFTSSG